MKLRRGLPCTLRSESHSSEMLATHVSLATRGDKPQHHTAVLGPFLDPLWAGRKYQGVEAPKNSLEQER